MYLKEILPYWLSDDLINFLIAVGIESRHNQNLPQNARYYEQNGYFASTETHLIAMKIAIKYNIQGRSQLLLDYVRKGSLDFERLKDECDIYENECLFNVITHFISKNELTKEDSYQNELRTWLNNLYNLVKYSAPFEISIVSFLNLCHKIIKQQPEIDNNSLSQVIQYAKRNVKVFHAEDGYELSLTMLSEKGVDSKHMGELFEMLNAFKSL